ncbi:MAG TPA: MFS transporter [Thermoleophilaceae bacterium]
MNRPLSTTAGFVAVAYALLVTMIGTTLPTPLYPLYQSRFGFGELVITVIFAVYAVGVICGLILTGRLSDEIGRRPVLLAGLACAALSSVVFLVAQGLAPLLVGRLLSGLSAGTFTGTATATLIDFSPADKRQRNAAIAAAVTLGGLGLGPLLAGALAQAGVIPLRLPYWMHLALLIPALPGILLAPEPVEVKEHPRFAPQKLAVPEEVRGTFARAGLGGFAAFAFPGLFGSLGPTFLAKFLGFHSHVTAGAIVWLLFMASVVGQIAIVRISDRAALVTGDAGTVAAAVFVIAALEAESLALLVLGGVAAGIGQGLAMGGGLAALAAETPPERRGEVNATFFVVLYAGLCVPTVAVGLLTQAIGLRSAGVAMSCVMGVLAAAVAVSLVARGRRSATPARP